MRVPPPQYHPSASPDLHIKAMKIELRHLITLRKRRSPVLMVQRVYRAGKDRIWVRQRRTLGAWAAVRIQSMARFFRWRKEQLKSIDEFLLEEDPRVRVCCCGCGCGCGCGCLYVHVVA